MDKSFKSREVAFNNTKAKNEYSSTCASSSSLNLELRKTKVT